MKQEFSAGIVTYYTAGNDIQYLLLHYVAGHWDFPKGHIEPGETKHNAAARELEEETGLTAQIKDGFEYSFSYPFKGYESSELKKKTVYFFVGQTFDKDVRLSLEHIDYTWLSYSEARKKLTYENAQNLLDEVHAFLTVI